MFIFLMVNLAENVFQLRQRHQEFGILKVTERDIRETFPMLSRKAKVAVWVELKKQHGNKH